MIRIARACWNRSRAEFTNGAPCTTSGLPFRRGISDGVKGGRLVWRLVGRGDRDQFLQKSVAVPCRRPQLPVRDRQAVAHQMLCRAIHSDDQAQIVEQYCGAVDMIQARHDSRSRGRSDR
jgi:hypothetical protein